jgi:peptidoglycan/LPS O-acetylase OafA/YrhL
VDCEICDQALRGVDCTIIVVIVLLKLVVAIFVTMNVRYSEWLLVFSQAFLQFDALLVGVLFARLYKADATALYRLKSRWMQFVAIAFAAVLMLWSPSQMFSSSAYVYCISNVLYALPFGVIILNVATNEKSIFNLEGSVYETPGAWSYGIYMYHSIVVYALVIISMKLSLDGLALNLFLYSFSIIITMVVAYLSFTYFEYWFLKKKEYFSEVLTSA